jgi:hypothetical protein
VTTAENLCAVNTAQRQMSAANAPTNILVAKITEDVVCVTQTAAAEVNFTYYCELRAGLMRTEYISF